MGNDSLALLYYNKAIMVDSINSFGNINPQRYKDRSDFYLNSLHNNKALKDIDKAIQLSPKDLQWYYYKAKIYSIIDDYENSLKYLKIVEEKDSLYTKAINLKALIYDELGKTELAVKEMEKLIKINEDPLYYSNIALCYSKIDQFDNALENFTKAIELEL